MAIFRSLKDAENENGLSTVITLESIENFSVITLFFVER